MRRMYSSTTQRFNRVGYKTLKEGDEVEFDIVQGSNGRPQADAVILVKGTAPGTA